MGGPPDEIAHFGPFAFPSMTLGATEVPYGATDQGPGGFLFLGQYIESSFPHDGNPGLHFGGIEARV